MEPEKHTPLTEKQMKNVRNKNTPKKDKEYLVTDDCFWIKNKPADYNVSDPHRAPHFITLVDMDSGTVVRLKSGSIIKVIDPVV